MRALILLIFTAILFGARAGAEDGVPAYLEKDKAELVALLEGHWSNDRQVFFAREAGWNPASLAPPQSLVLTAVPDDPMRLTALRTVADEAPVEIIYVLSIEPAREAVRQQMQSQAGAPLGCDVLWRRSAGGFTGEAEGAGCGALFLRPEARGRLRAELAVSATEFWIITARGDQQSVTQLRRARAFSCWVGVLRGASHGDSGVGLEDWDFRQDVRLHDQGGEAVIETREATPRRVRLKLRDVDWPQGDRRPSLTLYVHEGDDPRAVSYAWAEGGAGRIGINLRWLQASCTRDVK